MPKLQTLCLPICLNLQIGVLAYATSWGFKTQVVDNMFTDLVPLRDERVLLRLQVDASSGCFTCVDFCKAMFKRRENAYHAA